MSHKVASGIRLEKSLCRVTGVLFNTVGKKKREGFMTFLLRRAEEETEVTLRLESKFTLNIGYNHLNGTNT